MTAIERVHVRSALGRVLAAGRRLADRCPGPRQFGDGRLRGALRRISRPDGETVLKRVGESFAGKPWTGAIGAGECVRIFTGGVMPRGADSVVMQERASRRRERRAHRAGRVSQGGPEPAFRRRGSEGGTGRVSRRSAHASGRARDDRIARHRRDQRLSQAARRVFSTGDELQVRSARRSVAGEIYDSNRYTLHGMLTRLELRGASTWAWCADVPDELERAFAAAAANGRRRDHVAAASRWARPITSSSCSTSSAKCCSGRSP